MLLFVTTGDSELERQNVGHVDDNGTLYISDTKKPLFGGEILLYAVSVIKLYAENITSVTQQ